MYYHFFEYYNTFNSIKSNQKLNTYFKVSRFTLMFFILKFRRNDSYFRPFLNNKLLNCRPNGLNTVPCGGYFVSSMLNLIHMSLLSALTRQNK